MSPPSRLNEAQLNKLNNIFNPREPILSAISDSSAANNGVKALYLERAVTQSTPDFLSSLDILYNQNNAAASLPLVRALQYINDLYNDHPNSTYVPGGDNQGEATRIFSPLGNFGNDQKRNLCNQITAIIKDVVEDYKSEPRALQEIRDRQAQEGVMRLDSSWRSDVSRVHLAGGRNPLRRMGHSSGDD